MDAYIGEIRAFPFDFAPRHWAECNGQLLPISQNTALFAIIGNRFGGNGRTDFALPDLRQHAVAGAGQSPGLSNYELADKVGSSSVSLVAPQLPPHTHQWQAVRTPANTSTPTAGYLANIPSTVEFRAFTGPGTDLVPLHPLTVADSGQSVPHENRQPALSIGFYICTVGEFPPRP